MHEINTESNNEDFKRVDMDGQGSLGENQLRDKFLNPFSSTLLDGNNASSKQGNPTKKKSSEESSEQSQKDNDDDISFDYISRKSRLDNNNSSMKKSESGNDQQHSCHSSEKSVASDEDSDVEKGNTELNRGNQLETEADKESATSTTDVSAGKTKSDMATLKEVFDRQNNFFKKSPVKFNKAKEKGASNLDNSTDAVTTETFEEDLNADDSAIESGI